MGVADDLRDEVVLAFVVAEPCAEVSADRVIEQCRAGLPAYQVPVSVILLDDLPRTATGKVHRRALNGRTSVRTGGLQTPGAAGRPLAE